MIEDARPFYKIDPRSKAKDPATKAGKFALAKLAAPAVLGIAEDAAAAGTPVLLGGTALEEGVLEGEATTGGVELTKAEKVGVGAGVENVLPIR